MSSQSSATASRALILGVAATLTVSCSGAAVIPRPKPPQDDPYQAVRDFGGGRFSVVYPREAADIGQEGWVLLRMNVGEDACVSEVVAVDSSPSGLFERAAVAGYAGKCFIHPKLVDGQPVAVADVEQIVLFELE